MNRELEMWISERYRFAILPLRYPALSVVSIPALGRLSSNQLAYLEGSFEEFEHDGETMVR